MHHSAIGLTAVSCHPLYLWGCGRSPRLRRDEVRHFSYPQHTGAEGGFKPCDAS
jgi:hypothetical protein